MSITPGNALYLYRLLSEGIGIGRQTMLSRVEEVLVEDDILPEDMGFESVREVLEQLEFVRLTVFKRGRAYATVLAQPEWDALLEEPEEPQERKKPSAAGHKSWKRKRAAKVLQPAKPRPHRRPAEEDADAEAAASASEEAQVAGPAELEEPSPVLAEAPESELETELEPEPEPGPVELAEPAPSDMATQPQAPAPTSPARTVVWTPHEEPLVPGSFLDEVWCPSDKLAQLCGLLPLDVSPLTLLDEDWRVARSTEAYEVRSGEVTFALRCVRDVNGDGGNSRPVTVAMRRSVARASGKRWQLSSIDGPLDDVAVSLEGLPVRAEGVWAELDGLPAGTYRPVSPLRELAEFATLGPWDTTLPLLAELAEEEQWEEGLVGLRDYLAVTFARLKREGKVAVSESGEFAAFDTGLLTRRDAERIFACFDVCAGKVAWRLVEFSTDARVVPEPEPATYISAVEHLCLVPPYRVELGRALRIEHNDALNRAIEVAVRRARRDYRVATPAYDPQTDEMRLLLPLCVEEQGDVDRALVLARLGEGTYEARATLPLKHARICARVVTSDLPTWLS